MNDRFKYNKIKFKVWDKENKKYGKCYFTGKFDDSEYAIETEEKMEVCFCTGLKDCNGKDIYEGDIVRLDDELKCVAQFHKEYDMSYGRVDFILIGSHQKYPTIYIPTVAHESEIIGNIYTTPELLEGKE